MEKEKIHFVTGNKSKYNEVKELLEDVVRVDLNLSEIQSGDIYEVTREKARTAYEIVKRPVVVEDIGFYLECLNKFPGPLIKFFISSIGSGGIYDLVKNYKDKTAIVRCVVAYFDGKEFHFFTGDIRGKVVSPRGKDNFGFDPIFQPDGKKKTFSEMGKEKNKISHRRIAWGKLKSFLENKK
ncbi:MAG: RdgB/HAM1 family non-canonical purine NTP pyrophosphatase [Nanoarchaeota archaeon]|nr:RdgB/HAM1 family non-canonical purine NTP pyrophosphatase [Nanoarchaeota archaeon]